VPLTQNPVQWCVHLLAPWFTLSVLFIGFYSRVLRSTILDTINETTSALRAPRACPSARCCAHILRNSLIPIFSLFGLDLAQVIAAAPSHRKRSTTCTASGSWRGTRSAG